MLFLLEKALDPNLVGLKASQLARLDGCSFLIPRGFVLGKEAYEEHVEGLAIEEALRDIDLASVEALVACSHSIQDMILGKPLSLGLIDRIASHVRFKFRSCAVRSSSLHEDSGLSFAGIYDSFLDVDPNCLAYYIKLCWSGLYTPRAISYRYHNDIKKDSMAVIVQEMIHGISGVMFTAQPNTGEKETLIEYHAQGVVEGRTTPTSFVMNSNEDTSVNKLPIVCQQLLYRYGVILEVMYKSPVDVEWVYNGTSLYILQVRTLKTGQASTPKKSSFNVPLLLGSPVGEGMVTGVVQKLSSPFERFRAGNILVVKTTSPEWEPVMRRAKALITDQGSQTSHASLVAREMKLNARVHRMPRRILWMDK